VANHAEIVVENAVVNPSARRAKAVNLSVVPGVRYIDNSFYDIVLIKYTISYP
jgi:hypothetical protein